jgi:hypothetical protein
MKTNSTTRIGLFANIVKYLNAKHVGDVITRSKLLQLGYQQHYTVDKYRCMLTTAGYISKTDKAGHYKILAKPDVNLTVNELRNSIIQDTND